MAQNRPAAPEVLAAVENVVAQLTPLVALLTAEQSVSAETIAAVETAGRLMDAARVRAVAPLVCDPRAAGDLGYATAVSAVAALAQVSDRTARARLAVAAATAPDLSICGASLPPSHPIVAAALDAGKIGVDAAALISRELDAVAPRVAPEALSLAENVMVNLAAGLDPTGEREIIPVSVTYLTGEIQQIAATIDPDGALPREQRAKRARKFRLGAPNEDGLVPANGLLMPEVAALLAALIEAWRRSPRFVDANAVAAIEPADTNGSVDAGSVEAGSVGANGPMDANTADIADTRTPDQRRHDALAEVVMAAAAAKDAPQLNGAPVTVIVTVEAEDLEREDGLAGDPIGTMAGSSVPVSRGQVERFIDANGHRTVTKNANGAVIGISSPQRCFTSPQRLSIAARDGCRCARPGCTSPHYALQVHHVIPDRDGGPTTTDNGILLCYGCHLRVDDGPWEYRMVGGVPEARGPGVPEWTGLRPAIARAA